MIGIPNEEDAMPLAISRRTFAGTLGAAAGAALLDSPLAAPHRRGGGRRAARVLRTPFS